MVHHTMPTSSTSAPSASKTISHIGHRPLRVSVTALIVGILAACTTVPPQSPAPSVPSPTPLPSPARGVFEDESRPLPPALTQSKSRWVPVRWRELPGFTNDSLPEAWVAWLKSCERAVAPISNLCPDVRRLSIASADEQRAWMVQRLQAYRVEPLEGRSDGLLTSYYEPVFNASRTPSAAFGVPLYRVPANFSQRKPWYSRQEMDSLPEARAALRGNELLYLADPIDAVILQTQGSGRVRVTEPNGTQRMVRMAYAATNDQPYRSPVRWLLDQKLIKDASWPSIKNWAAQNPQRVQDMLWSNPRVVFFQEEAVSGDTGPRGAQGVPLTAGRSIAVDKASIPYGTPVWLATSGPAVNLQRLVLAQDTGSAIVGAVRADYYAGSGDAAGELAGRVKQPLQLWVLWPK
jgi:membrane-bound lytic murein transglycosylase A